MFIISITPYVKIASCWQTGAYLHSQHSESCFLPPGECESRDALISGVSGGSEPHSVLKVQILSTLTSLAADLSKHI